MAPFKLAIIGGGPSAFYAASRLLALLPSSNPNSPLFRIHMYDRLWAPHGLVRYGVAPDHPEVKNCTKKFDSAATDPRFRFFGNVNVGADTPNSIGHALKLPFSSILSNYTHLLFATGCTLPIPHPALHLSSYCIPALSFVHWYTRHPSQPSAPPLDKASHVTLIGNGNVALDVARILLSCPTALSKYDIPQPVLDILSRSAVQHVSIVGRRGPLEAAFTAKELREMMNLPEASMIPLDPQLLTPPPDVSLKRQQTRIMQILQQGSKTTLGSTPKTWSLEFFRAPTNLSPPSPATPPTLTLAHTTVDPTTHRAVPTGQTSTLATSLVITSLGFRAEPTAPFYDPTLGHFCVVAGRVAPSIGSPLKNIYASGWAATGAKGVLASTMMDSYAVAETIISDWLPKGEVIAEQNEDARMVTMNPEPHPEEPPQEIQAGLKEGVVTEYGGWRVIDAEEMRRGMGMGKERERMGWEEARNFLASRRQSV